MNKPGSSKVPADRTKEVDALLARALVTCAPWPELWHADPTRSAVVVERALYHGIAALLSERPEALLGWPEPLLKSLRRQALGQTMWEARHFALLQSLLAAMAARGVGPLLLKGTALAYDLYEFPAQRARGDTDMLIARAELEGARAALQEIGFVEQTHDASGDDLFIIEECWTHHVPGGGEHSIDLHTQPLNTFVHSTVLTFSELLAGAHPLPQLSPAALAPDHVSALMHCCLHRAQHLHSPYHVGGRSYLGGNRLIWLMDIRLLAGALAPADWDVLCNRASDKGISRFCHDGLDAAGRQLGAAIPVDVLHRLSSAGHDSPLYRHYHDPNRVRRSIRHVIAVPGFGSKARLLWRHAFPPASLVRTLYPDMIGRPLFLIHMRRLSDLLRRAVRR